MLKVFSVPFYVTCNNIRITTEVLLCLHGYNSGSHLKILVLNNTVHAILLYNFIPCSIILNVSSSKAQNHRRDVTGDLDLCCNAWS